MPGVPSSLACDACRQARKKCASKRAPCARCARLGIACVGIGIQRFKFIAGESKELAVRSKTTTPPKNENSQTVPLVETSRTQRRGQQVWRIYRDPARNLCDETSRLRSAFIRVIDPTTTLDYQLSWAFGGFILEIPRRLGINEALDAAAHALVITYALYRRDRATATTKSLQLQSHAFSALRHCLDDPIKAKSAETLAAIMLIQVLESMDGQMHGMLHAVAAAQILKARGNIGPTDAFESKVLLSLRGPVVVSEFVGMRNDLSRAEYDELIEKPSLSCGGTKPEDIVLKCLSRTSTLLRYLHETGEHDAIDSLEFEELIEETSQLRLDLQSTLQNFQVGLKAASLSNEAAQVLQRANCLRSYAFGASVAIATNSTLESAIARHDSATLCMHGYEYSSELSPESLQNQSKELADSIIELEPQARPFRPMGAMWMSLCLAVAYVGAQDSYTQEKCTSLYFDYVKDVVPFTAPQVDMYLRFLKQYFRAGTPGPCC